MTAYQAEQWHELFVMTGGAAAALAGLIFVAVSLNQESILMVAALPALALRTLSTLIGVVVFCVIGLIPEQSRGARGIEILVVGLVMAGFNFVTTVRNFSGTTVLIRRIILIILSAGSSIPAVIAGISLVAGAGGGLYWLALELASAIVVAAYHAWILLILIRTPGYSSS